MSFRRRKYHFFFSVLQGAHAFLSIKSSLSQMEGSYWNAGAGATLGVVFVFQPPRSSLGRVTTPYIYLPSGFVFYFFVLRYAPRGIACYEALLQQKQFSRSRLSEVRSHSPDLPKSGSENGGRPPTRSSSRYCAFFSGHHSALNVILIAHVYTVIVIDKQCYRCLVFAHPISTGNTCC